MTIFRVSAVCAVFLAGAAGAQCPVATLNPSTLANPSVTQFYTTSFSASAPGIYQFEGQNLPPGLTLTSEGTLSGTPSAIGNSYSRIVATDGAGCVVTRSLPIAVDAAACVNLAVGAVALLDATQAADFCIAPSSADTEYTVVPVNVEGSTDVSLAATATNVIAVTGPPSPRPATSEGLTLAPLAEPEHVEFVGDDVRASDLPSIAAPLDRARHLIAPGLRGGTPPVVDQILDIQVASGCSGTLDMRKGRVEAVSPVSTPARPRLYIVQEVVEQAPPGSGIWNPALPGGFSRTEFEHAVQMYDQAPPTQVPAGGIFGSSLTLNARDTLTTNFGENTDLDNNGGTIVFFTRAVNELSPPASSSIANAVFEQRDLFSAAPGSCPRSNEGEYIYMLMPDPTGVVNSNVRTLSAVAGNAHRVLAHQMTHQIAAARRIYVTLGSTPEEPWLDEALAWTAEELLFFNVSIGLAPRSNIVVTDLTTGPNASRRVAAFNSYANPRFGVTRLHYLQNPTLPGINARVGPLRRTPYAATGAVNAHEQRVNQYGISGTFLRYAADRLNGSDATFFQALVNSPSVGMANLQAAIGGADPNVWARDFDIAHYSDDAVTGNAPPYTLPSWNYRSLYTALNGSYQLVPTPLSDGVTNTALLGAGGGPRWFRFGITGNATQPALMSLRTAPSDPPPASLLTAVIRTN